MYRAVALARVAECWTRALLFAPAKSELRAAHCTHAIRKAYTTELARAPETRLKDYRRFRLSLLQPLSKHDFHPPRYRYIAVASEHTDTPCP